jgi:hypothetical protein
MPTGALTNSEEPSGDPRRGHDRYRGDQAAVGNDRDDGGGTPSAPA